MRVVQLKIENFRGIAKGDLFLPEHAVFVGDNNSGKSSVLEAIDLVLGPDRLSRQPPIDEHDFYAGRYMGSEEKPVEIRIEATISGLSSEQTRYFKDHLEWWDNSKNTLLTGPPAEGTDAENVSAALRIGFTGHYDKEEDDFVAKTYFLSPSTEDGSLAPFKTSDKRLCGFLFLRTLRTGSRALSLERGSLLDIILRLKEIRLQMWEQVLDQLRKLPVAQGEELGVSEILTSVQKAVRSIVPSDWAENPHLRVSELTREHLRRTLTVFMGTGSKRDDGSEYAAPFHHQGTGTINILVLAMLSLIAELKQNVIFAMEEPEIAIPPHTQKRIIDSVRAKSAQALFTSHSPYVLEEFPPSQILVLKRESGVLSVSTADFPSTIKPKHYRVEFRTRFTEALLARRVLIVEGRTEYDALRAAARRLNELDAKQFSTLEALGIAVFDATGDSQFAPLAEHFRKLGKTVFAIFDKQDAARSADIAAKANHSFESPEKGFEDLVILGTGESALRRFALALVTDREWPSHLYAMTPSAATPLIELQNALREYLRWAKGAGNAADLLCSCSIEEMPVFIRVTLVEIKKIVEPPLPAPTESATIPNDPAVSSTTVSGLPNASDKLNGTSPEASSK